MENFLRRFEMPRSMERWSLGTLREKPIKIGAKVVIRSPDVLFQITEMVVTRELFAAILDRIQSSRGTAAVCCSVVDAATEPEVADSWR